MPFERQRLKATLARLADQGVFLGTSSWKYAGWRGRLYDESRYVRRGRFSEGRFERLCLAEYAEVFKTVCVDATYYKFPEPQELRELVSLAPPDFLFAFKVTDEITRKRFPRLPRSGIRAGQLNGNFLNADLFAEAFLAPCEAHRSNVGLLIFQFSTFYRSEFARGRAFVGMLDEFLGRLPKGWRYGVEIRNRTFLHPEYFATLARHGVAHIYNSWSGMPPVNEQLALPGSRTNPAFYAVRFQLKPGRKYAEAVEMFQPYDRVKEANPEARATGTRLIKETVAAAGRTKAFLFINNRFEGNALETIDAMVAEQETNGQAHP